MIPGKRRSKPQFSWACQRVYLSCLEQACASSIVGSLLEN